jgi:hypothetical protein
MIQIEDTPRGATGHRDHMSQFFKDAMIIISFLADPLERTIERNVYTLYDIGAELGGCVEIITITAALVLGSYSSF